MLTELEKRIDKVKLQQRIENIKKDKSELRNTMTEMKKIKYGKTMKLKMDSCIIQALITHQI